MKLDSDVATLEKNKEIYHAHFNSDPFSVALVVEELLDRIALHCAARDTQGNVEIAVTEAINNIAEHAYCGQTNQPIELLVQHAPNGFDITLTDAGIEMPEGKPPIAAQHDLNGPVSSLPEGGFGWSLIRSLSRDLKYARTGRENRLSFRVII